MTRPSKKPSHLHSPAGAWALKTLLNATAWARPDMLWPLAASADVCGGSFFVPHPLPTDSP